MKNIYLSKWDYLGLLGLLFVVLGLCLGCCGFSCLVLLISVVGCGLVWCVFANCLNE